MFDNKRIFITGGTGSWGHELVSQLISGHNPREIIIFSRGEHRQVEMKRFFSNNLLKFVIGDVRDKESLERALQIAKAVSLHFSRFLIL